MVFLILEVSNNLHQNSAEYNFHVLFGGIPDAYLCYFRYKILLSDVFSCI